jgi:DNA-binding NtrC family response regulator
MDDLTQQLADLGVQLAASAARNTASAVSDKIGAMRASRSAGDQVAALEQIVSDLITDKNELTRIAQAYQHELVAQQLTPGDVRYITDTVVPLLEQIADGMENRDEGAQLKKQVQTFKPLLSVETVNILQLLGFNFRQGIGAPLTQRLKALIEGTGGTGGDLQAEALRTQRAAIELAADPDAYARFREMYPAN